MTSHRLSRRIDDVLRLQPDAPALEYDHQWLSWGQLRDLAEQISSLTGTDRPQVGILLRNRPAHVAALLGVLRCGATVVVINPGRGDERIKADVDQLALPLIIGEPDDLAVAGGPPATTVVSISAIGAMPKVVAASQIQTYEARPEVAVRMLTSGTTGPPKRVDLTYDMLAHSVMGPEAEHVNGPNRVASRCGDREFTAGAYRWGLPSPAMRCRAAPLCVAGTIRAQSVGRSGTRTSTSRGVAGADRAKDGAAFRRAS